MDVFRFTIEELEELLDQAKVAVLTDLLHKDFMNAADAERYATTNTIILKKKHFFRTLTDKWRKSSESSYYMLVVGNERIASTVETEPSGKKKGVVLSMLDKVLKNDGGVIPTSDSTVDDGPTVSE